MLLTCLKKRLTYLDAVDVVDRKLNCNCCWRFVTFEDHVIGFNFELMALWLWFKCLVLVASIVSASERTRVQCGGNRNDHEKIIGIRGSTSGSSVGERWIAGALGQVVRKPVRAIGRVPWSL